jgi:hypothetical protein
MCLAAVGARSPATVRSAGKVAATEMESARVSTCSPDDKTAAPTPAEFQRSSLRGRRHDFNVLMILRGLVLLSIDVSSFFAPLIPQFPIRDR